MIPIWIRNIITLAGFIVLLSLFFVIGETWGDEQKPPKISDMDYEFAQSLKAREDKVVALEINLAEREKELSGVQKEVEEKLAKLVDLQREVKGQLESLGAQQDAQFQNLIKIYSTISSTKVAPLLNKMDDETVAQILRAMKSDIVAKIIPKLESDKAVSVSKKLGMLQESVAN